MNSETLKDFNNVSPYIENERAKQARLESEVEEKGELALSFMQHRFWLLFDKELEKIIDDMNNRLINSGDLKKSQMDRLIDMIRLTKVFRKIPSAYVDKLKLLIDRKRKLIKES